MIKANLEALGWKMYYQCNTCSGHREYYSHREKKGYEIRVRVKSKTFSIMLDNMIISGPHWAFELEEKLKQHVS